MAEITRPRSIFIGRGDDTQKLYGLEEKRKVLIQKCAEELQKLDIHENMADFWNCAMPQALYDVLEGYSPNLTRAVCTAWLEDHPEQTTAATREGGINRG
jgi:hypothetical protein